MQILKSKKNTIKDDKDQYNTNPDIVKLAVNLMNGSRGAYYSINTTIIFEQAIERLLDNNNAREFNCAIYGLMSSLRYDCELQLFILEKVSLQRKLKKISCSSNKKMFGDYVFDLNSDFDKIYDNDIKRFKFRYVNNWMMWVWGEYLYYIDENKYLDMCLRSMKKVTISDPYISYIYIDPIKIIEKSYQLLLRAKLYQSKCEKNPSPHNIAMTIYFYEKSINKMNYDALISLYDFLYINTDIFVDYIKQKFILTKKIKNLQKNIRL